MPLYNGKIELKLKWTKYCVLSAAGNDNVNDNNSNNISYYQGTRLYMFLLSLFQQVTSKNHQNFMAENLKDSLSE